MKCCLSLPQSGFEYQHSDDEDGDDDDDDGMMDETSQQSM